MAKLKRTVTSVGALKKTTKKGAYKKARVKNFNKRLNPFTENKTITEAEMTGGAGTSYEIVDPRIYRDVPNDDACTIIMPLPFTSMAHGLYENQMIGNSVFSKYLKMKYLIKFPEYDATSIPPPPALPVGGLPIDFPVSLFMIHGWITLPVGLTGQTTPVASSWTRALMETWVSERVRDYYNERDDVLEWIPKVTSNIKILGKRLLRPNRNKAISLQGRVADLTAGGNATFVAGPLPTVYGTCSWPTFKKVHYTYGSPQIAGETLTDDNLSHSYPNSQWVPFAALYSPNFGDFVEPVAGVSYGTNPIQVSHNTIHYFQDS